MSPNRNIIFLTLLLPAISFADCDGCAPDGKRHIKYSNKTVHKFKKSHPCPSTRRTFGKCPGYVIDYIVPLKNGGEDIASNMKWLTKTEAKTRNQEKQ
jgi:hypothetical protein